MPRPPHLHLLTARGLDHRIQARIDYCFRVYCAFHGVSVSESPDGQDVLCLCYGVGAETSNSIPLTASYLARPLDKPAPAAATYRPPTEETDPRAQDAFPCFHPIDPVTGPDWLGEAFEWLSCADERAILDQDSVGRIPFGASLCGRNGLEPTRPHAAVAFGGLAGAIRRVVGDRYPQRPASPWADGARFAVAPSHDLDFLPLRRAWRWTRFAKNLLNACSRRDALLASELLASLGRSFRGGPPILYGLDAMCQGESALGIRSTSLAIPAHHHFRDAWYRVDDERVQALLDQLRDAASEIGVHGSYCSLDEPGRLAEEFQKMEAVGYRSVGGRQHFLRFRWFDHLFSELLSAGAIYDSTLAFSGHLGFRAGACFPYPPYDFESEAAYPLIEVPLAIMDGSLYLQGLSGRTWAELAEGVLENARQCSWGGLSILWHNSVFGGGCFPQEIVDLYWSLKRPDEPWIPLREVAETVWPRYAAAGVLPPSPPRSSPRSANG